jgi:hypothetical protein
VFFWNFALFFFCSLDAEILGFSRTFFAFPENAFDVTSHKRGKEKRFEHYESFATRWCEWKVRDVRIFICKSILKTFRTLVITSTPFGGVFKLWTSFCSASNCLRIGGCERTVLPRTSFAWCFFKASLAPKDFEGFLEGCIGGRGEGGTQSSTQQHDSQTQSRPGAQSSTQLPPCNSHSTAKSSTQSSTQSLTQHSHWPRSDVASFWTLLLY